MEPEPEVPTITVRCNCGRSWQEEDSSMVRVRLIRRIMQLERQRDALAQILFAAAKN